MAFCIKYMLYRSIPPYFKQITVQPFLMMHAGWPTKQLYHIDISHYILCAWVEYDLIVLKDVASGLNAADAVPTSTGGTLFAQHVDTFTGCLPPLFISSCHLSHTCSSSLKVFFDTLGKDGCQCSCLSLFSILRRNYNSQSLSFHFICFCTVNYCLLLVLAKY